MKWRFEMSKRIANMDTTTGTEVSVSDYQSYLAPIVYESNRNSNYNNAMSLVYEVADSVKGFAADVAQSVKKYGKMSAKQQYVIAKAAYDSKLFTIEQHNLYMV